MPTIRRHSRLGLLALAALFASLAARNAPAKDEPFPRELVAWVPVQVNPLFRGAGGDAWDEKIRERGWIIPQRDGFALYFTGYRADKSRPMSLGRAFSRDGLRWWREPETPLTHNIWVEDMCIIQPSGKTYFMFAEGEKDIAHLLTSEDGLKWEEQGPLDIRLKDGKPISAGPRGTPTAWFEDGTWSLFYERMDQGVWLARSKDMKVWTNAQDDPVLALGPDKYDQAAIAVNQIIKRDGIYYAFYHANSERPWKDWTTNIARSKDLIHWEKYSKNPIIGDNSSSGIFLDFPSGPRLYTMHPEVRLHVNPAPIR